MSAYFASVITAAVAVSLVSLLSPRDNETGKYVRHIASLVMLLVIASPLGTSFDGSVDFWESFDTDSYDGELTGGDYRDTVIEKTAEVIAENVKADASELFKINPDHITVTVTMNADDYSDVTLDTITITLKSYGAWADSDAICGYFSDIYECYVEVCYE